MPTINTTITLGLVVKINEGIDLQNFLMRDTEWLGEPKTADGCVVAINPKAYGVDATQPILQNKSLVKSVRQIGKKNWMKRYKSICEALQCKEGYELMDNKLAVINISDMVGKKVSYLKDDQIITVEVGSENSPG